MASRRFRAFGDRFTSLPQVAQAIREEGLGRCGLIFGIDYTMSNKVQGEKTFYGKSLHAIEDGLKNPYQQVIEILGQTLECFDDDKIIPALLSLKPFENICEKFASGRICHSLTRRVVVKVIEILGQTLECFDDDKIIPAFGFGDITTKDQAIFPLKMSGECIGFQQVLETYNTVTPTVKLHRPTNFAPLIYKAIQIVEQTKKYHILVIVADGQVTAEEDTQQAIVKASQFPLSIIVIGVGDGPWGMMQDFDDKLPTRLFDNFQFVNFHEVMSTSSYPPASFALNCLMEIPDQYKAIKQLGFLDNEI